MDDKTVTIDVNRAQAGLLVELLSKVSVSLAIAPEALRLEVAVRDAFTLLGGKIQAA